MVVDGQAATLARLRMPRILDVDMSMMDLLQAATPVLKRTKMEKKQRSKRNKNIRQERRKKAAVAVEEDTGVRSDFVHDPNRPWETGKTLTEFHLFKKLAPELRQMIWAEVLPGAQAIKISQDGYTQEYQVSLTRRKHLYIYRAKATYHPSPLLYINRESRAVLTSKNPLAFAAQLGGRPIRFNFKRDILYFDSPFAMVSFYGGTLPLFQPELETFGYKYDMSEVHDKVQNVAVGEMRLYKGTVGGTLNQFKALKTIILGGARGEELSEPYDMVVDLMTGDERLIFGWERFQNFKTPEDDNMPSVERYRKDRFDKLVLQDYAQFMGPPMMEKTDSKIPSAAERAEITTANTSFLENYKKELAVREAAAQEANAKAVALRPPPSKSFRRIGVAVNC